MKERNASEFVSRAEESPRSGGRAWKDVASIKPFCAQESFEWFEHGIRRRNSREIKEYQS